MSSKLFYDATIWWHFLFLRLNNVTLHTCVYTCMHIKYTVCCLLVTLWWILELDYCNQYCTEYGSSVVWNADFSSFGDIPRVEVANHQFHFSFSQNPLCCFSTVTVLTSTSVAYSIAFIPHLANFIIAILTRVSWEPLVIYSFFF